MIRLRKLRSEDSDALYAISLATGHQGGDASHLYRDPELMGHIYSAPYARLEPCLVLVAVDDDDEVAGFVAGALDTSAWEDRLEQKWWPVLRRRYPEPDPASSSSWTADQRRASMIHHPERAPRDVVDAYPAHLHLNLLPRVQGRGVGSMLLQTWLELASERGATAVHIGVNHANLRALRFWRQNGFRDLNPEEREEGRTVWLGRS
jgi:ribosomal protein S18 acetylase RimI-like enzyme